MNCRPGDLAIVVDSYLKENIGKIVMVLEAYRDQGFIVLADRGHVWHCEAAGSPLAWSKAWGIGVAYSQSGPVPDHCLRPLREKPEDDEVNTRVETSGLADNKMLA